MPLPKRIYLEDYPYFIVFNTYHRIPLFTSQLCCEILIDNLKFYRNKYEFKFLGFAIIPCHFLGIFLPKRPKEISKIINDIKSYARTQIISLVKNSKIVDYYYPCGKKCFCEIYPKDSIAQSAGGPTATRYGNDSGIPRKSWTPGQLWQPSSSLKELLIPNTMWQRRFWDHVIRNEEDFEEKLNYINNNAVKHGLVDDPVVWRFSSAINYYLNNHSTIKIDQIN